MLNRATDEERVIATYDDGTLYERWLENRDGDAFAEISRRHAPVVYDLACRYSGDASLAEDLVQEALLDLALAGSRKPIEVGLIAWMARFAMCRARNVRSSERSRRKRQQIVGGRRRENVMPDDHLERDEELQHALGRAEPDERIVLAMRYLHGWDYGRIAAALVISEGAARVRVHRALGALRSRLGVVPTATSGGTNGNRTKRPAANGNRTNGSAKHSSPLVALVAAQTLYSMPDGLLELGTQTAIEAATAAASASTTGHLGAHSAPRVGRLTLQALGLSSALMLVTAVSLTASEPSESLTTEGRTFASLFSPFVGDVGRDARVRGGSENHWRAVLPRPPEWDGGVLERLRPGGDQTTEAAPGTARDEPSVAAAPRPPVPADASSDRPVGVPRPTSRDARAATRVSVSSVDERAGSPGGRSAYSLGPSFGRGAANATATALSTAASSPPPASKPGLPADLVNPDRTRTPRRLDRLQPTTALADLPPEQADLVSEAAALVRQVVAGDGLGSDGLGARGAGVSKRQAQKQARRLKKQYRAARKRLHQAALASDEDAIAYEGAYAAKVQTAQHVLRLLMDVVLADGRAAGDLVWPEGADVTAALEDVVHVLGTLLPDGAAGADTRGAPLEGVPSEFLPGGALLPDGALMPNGTGMRGGTGAFDSQASTSDTE